MAKPKAERWLTESFAAGVEERDGEGAEAWAYGERLEPWCWLAQHDPARRPCSGKTEIFHFIPRQRIENALGALLPEQYAGSVMVVFDPGAWTDVRAELILIAAWDPRNGGLGCEHHHRRFDGHATSSTAPKIIVPRFALPGHVEEFVADYGLESATEERFPAAA